MDMQMNVTSGLEKRSSSIRLYDDLSDYNSAVELYEIYILHWR